VSDVDETVEAPVESDGGASEASAEVDSDAGSGFDWNGEVDSLQQADWFTQLDEPVRNGLLGGIKQKYNNWEKGYTSKYQELATTKTKFRDRETQLKEQEARVQRWMYGDENPLDEARSEMDRMKVQHEAALDALRSEYEKALEDIRTAGSGELQEAIKARDEAIAKIQGFEQERQAQEEQQIEAQVNELETWLESNAADVVANDDAFYTWCVLCTGGATPEDALQMVRAKYGAPEAATPTPEAPPKGVELMNMDGGRTGTQAGKAKTFDEIMDEMRRAAQSNAL
jgi:hypothetical protein